MNRKHSERLARELAVAAVIGLSTLIASNRDQARAQDLDTASSLSVPVSDQEVVRGDPDRAWVSLVFNAGAGSPPATQILDTLRERRLVATFFIMGWWAERQPDLVARIAAEGHEIASHGHEIFDLTTASNTAVVGDLERADAVISSITGRTTKPLWSPSAGYRDARVRSLAASIGYRPIFWTLDSGDWPTDARASAVRDRVLNNATNGAIIVMHFDSPRTADSIASTLPEIIDSLQTRGYRLVTVTELVTGQLGPNRDLTEER